ncbi:MAG: MraY family glycosyltransferase [Thermoanaerobaculia bacterium]
MAAIAAIVSAAGVRLVAVHAAALKLVDVPNERSSHVVPTPRGGGLGILGGMAVALLLAGLVVPAALTTKAVALVGLALVVAGAGLADDRAGVSARLRLVLHLSAATALAFAVGVIPELPLPSPFPEVLLPPAAAVVVTVVWVSGVTNFFNFMDGVDGLAGGQAALSAIGVAAAGWADGATFVGLALAGASSGFLIHNWPPARVFMGDVGSGTVGFLLAGLPLLAPPGDRARAVLAVAVGLTFFILDPVLTLARRARAGKPLMQAHREHLYQRLIPAGTSGARVTTLLLAGAAALVGLGSVAFRKPGLVWLAIGGAVVLFLIEWVAAFRSASRRERVAGRSSAANGAESRSEDR